MVLGLVTSVALAHGSIVKALAMIVLGLLLGLVGTDIYTGTPRFTLRISANWPTASISWPSRSACSASPRSCAIWRTSMIARCPMRHVSGLMPRPRGTEAHRRARAARHRRSARCWACCPAAGHILASFAAYTVEKRISRTPRAFRQGHDRRRRGAGSGQQCRRADLVHPDADARHSVQPGHGADDRRHDHPGHHARPECRDRASRRCSGASSSRCGSATCCW